MTDVTLQYVDNVLIERIRSLARERQWSINDVLLHALRDGLGISAAQQFSESLRDPDAPGVLDGHWEDAEKGAFQAALCALANTVPTQLAPESIRASVALPGAE